MFLVLALVVIKQNNLQYKVPASFSAVQFREQITNYTTGQTVYNSLNSREIVFNINSSVNYVSLQNSYLRFKLKGEGAATSIRLGSAGVLGVIERVYIESRDGSELERNEEANRYLGNKLYNECSADYVQSVNAMLGTPADQRSQTTVPAFAALREIDVENVYCIPLSLISGFFKPIDGSLLPPMFVKKGKILK